MGVGVRVSARCGSVALGRGAPVEVPRDKSQWRRWDPTRTRPRPKGTDLRQLLPPSERIYAAGDGYRGHVFASRGEGGQLPGIRSLSRLLKRKEGRASNRIVPGRTPRSTRDGTYPGVGGEVLVIQGNSVL